MFYLYEKLCLNLKAIFHYLSKRKCFDVANYLNQNEISHNLVFVISEPYIPLKSEEETGSVDRNEIKTLRFVIWPKKPSTGNIFFLNIFIFGLIIK